MEILMGILLLLGGCAVFLMGMKLMSDGLERSAGKSMRAMFAKISNNRMAAYGIGVAATAIVQSSSATSVMTMGLVNSGIVNTRQAGAIILGAKVGTTVTAIMLAFSTLGMGGFKINILFAALALVGVFMLMFNKSDTADKLGLILTGFGLLFVGMIVMGNAFGNVEESALGKAFLEIFELKIFLNPFLLILIGMIFTAIIQSSSAASGIYIAMLSSGIITDVGQAFFLMIGSNIGTCMTAILASIGAKTNARRTAFLHTVEAAIAAVTLGTLCIIFHKPLVEFFTRLFPNNNEWSLATFNLIYNVIYTLALLPFLPKLVRLSEIVIKDKKSLKQQRAIKYIDELTLASPPVAQAQVQKEVLNMAALSKENLKLSYNAIIKDTLGDKAKILSQEEDINYLNKEIANYLIKLSSLTVARKDERLIGSLHHVINDIERIGDHAKNFIQTAEELSMAGIQFSEDAVAELNLMFDKVMSLYELSEGALQYRDRYKLAAVQKLEDEVDSMKNSYFDHHLSRLKAGNCSVEAGTFFYSIVTQLERIADHLVNIAFSIKDPTGQSNLQGGKTEKYNEKQKPVKS